MAVRGATARAFHLHGSAGGRPSHGAWSSASSSFLPNRLSAGPSAGLSPVEDTEVASPTDAPWLSAVSGRATPTQETDLFPPSPRLTGVPASTTRYWRQPISVEPIAQQQLSSGIDDDVSNAEAHAVWTAAYAAAEAVRAKEHRALELSLRLQNCENDPLVYTTIREARQLDRQLHAESAHQHSALLSTMTIGARI
jgi:hypothetical protein